MLPLTRTQRRIFTQLQRLNADGGYQPSYRELATSLGLASPASIHVHLKTLEAKGYLKRDTTGKLVPVHNTTHQAMTLPVRWRISKDAAPQVVSGFELRAVPAITSSADEHFLVVVADDSYTDMHLLPEDCLVVAATPIARNGDVVLAKTTQGTAVRRYQRDGNTYRLHALSPTAAPLVLERVEVLGIVRSVIRTLNG